MGNEIIEGLLENKGVRPTSNRLLVLREIMRNGAPLSLSDIERNLVSLDKSSISRVLNLLQKHHVIHGVEDGRGIIKYEICHADEQCSVGDMHAHFYCEKCGKVYCFEEISAPIVDVPDGFRISSINYMLKGVCPSCAKTFKE